MLVRFECFLWVRSLCANRGSCTNSLGLLDGGGVRGLSSLYILKEVMKSVSPTKKPCEVFDMIAGTSAGG